MCPGNQTFFCLALHTQKKEIMLYSGTHKCLWIKKGLFILLLNVWRLCWGEPLNLILKIYKNSCLLSKKTSPKKSQVCSIWITHNLTLYIRHGPLVLVSLTTEHSKGHTLDHQGPLLILLLLTAEQGQGSWLGDGHATWGQWDIVFVILWVYCIHRMVCLCNWRTTCSRLSQQ